MKLKDILNESKYSGKTIKDIKTNPKKNKITITFDGGGKLILMSKMGTDKTGHDKAEIYIWG
jgi:hypothetical protein